MEQNKSLLESKSVVLLFQPGKTSSESNDHDIGWQKLYLLSHPNATLAPQARQARARGESLNNVTLAPLARPSGEILNYLLSR